MTIFVITKSLAVIRNIPFFMSINYWLTDLKMKISNYCE